MDTLFFQLFVAKWRDGCIQVIASLRFGQQYRQSLSKIPVPDGIKTEELLGYQFYNNENAVRGSQEVLLGRFALNVLPDQLIGVVQHMVQRIAPLSYVSNLKVVSDTDGDKRLDKVVILFCDSTERNKQSELGQHLLEYAKYTQPSHPAMMEPIAPDVQGIAFADQRDGTSFTDTRTLPIAEAMMNLSQMGQDITLETLELEVKKAFRHIISTLIIHTEIYLL
jgi:hypothetical protein